MMAQEHLVGIFTRAGAAASSLLNQVLGRNIEISPPEVSVGSRAAVAMSVSGVCTLCCTTVDAGRPGAVLHGITPPFDTLLPELIVNPAAAARPPKFTELHRGALAEFMAAYWPTATGIFGDGFGVTFNTAGASEIMHGSLDSAFNSLPLFSGIESFVFARHQIKIKDFGAGYFFVVMPAVFMQELLRGGEAPAARAQKPTATAPIAEIPMEHITTHTEGATRSERIVRTHQPQAEPHDSDRNLKALLDVPVDVIVQLGQTSMDVKDILALAPGRVVELDQVSGEPISVLVNGSLIARGEVVVVGENFGLKVTTIVKPDERL